MPDVIIEILAYAMEAAYRNNKTQDTAVGQVKIKYTQADINILEAMWAAIDAYVDINTN